MRDLVGALLLAVAVNLAAANLVFALVPEPPAHALTHEITAHDAAIVAR